MKQIYSASLFMLAICFLSCQKDVDSSQLGDYGQAELAASLKPCGSPFDTTLINFGGQPSGSLEVLNDDTSFHMIIREPFDEYKISRVEILHGTQQFVIDNIVGLIDCNTMFPRNPPTIINYTPDVDSVAVVSLPFGSDNCVYVHAHIKLTKRDAAGTELHSFWIWPNGTANASQNPCQQYFRYCRQSCGTDSIPPPPVDNGSCGPLRTQTQGGWGAPPNGNNPGVYLHNTFALAFPTGLTLGCNNGYRLSLTSAQAITSLLPSGGKAEKLGQHYTNPSDLKNVLVGQLVALTLNTGFDKYDGSFGPAGRRLGDMYIKTGTFSGKTVAQFLEIANNVIGGCSDAYKITDINETASKINENYKDGHGDGGFLVCTF